MQEIRFIYKDVEIVIFAPDNDHITGCISLNGFYELTLLKHSKDKLKDNPVIIDAGANIGNHTVFWSKLCNAKVHAFEPCVSAWMFLEKNVSLNGIKNASLYNSALGDCEGFGYSEISKGNLGGSKFIKNAGSTHMRTIDSLKLDRVDLIKVDVEGMELDVLHGAVQTLIKFQPMIYVETDNEEVFDYLDMLGYKKLNCFNHTPTWFFERKEK